MKYKVTATALILALSVMLMSPVAALAAPPNSSALAVPISGTATNTTTGALNTITGTLNIQGFANQNGSLVALGTLVATVTNAAGTVLNTIVTQVAVPVTASGTCPVLHLVLGPLNLNLLGLNVSLNQVVLDITAQSGPGNLLGNLVCAIANLLNSNGSVTSIANLLNQLLGAL